ncbi:MAG: hypothetical protein WCH79_16985, partial [Planctomycetia bacterium]
DNICRVPAEAMPQLEKLARMAGYRFVLRENTPEKSVGQGSSLTVKMKWANVGVAKLYRTELHARFGLYDEALLAHDHELFQRFAEGGARFVHGGAMPQEIVVPVVTIRQLKGKGKQDTATKKVDVQILGVVHKITTPRYRFTLLQTEPVTDRVKPITLKVAVYEGSTPVTNIGTVTFDSDSQSIDERTKAVILTLEDRTFDKRTKYRLVLRDSETDIEQSSMEVTIDRTFSDDF